MCQGTVGDDKMTQIFQIRKSLVGDVELQQKGAQLNIAPKKDDRFTDLLENMSQQILAVTYWFEPNVQADPYPVTIRFSGHRVDVQGRLLAGDRFVQDETIENVIPESGPISVTARVSGINPGKWVVTAQLQGMTPSTRKSKSRKQGHVPPTGIPIQSSMRLWHKWAPIAGSTEPISTCLLPFVRVPGILPGAWGILALLGILVALIFQTLVIAQKHLLLGSVGTVSLVSISVGIISAKTWYVVSYRRERLIAGWCIQGFITGAILTATILLVLLKVPVGTFLDVTVPGLLIAMAVGRVGCFFAGCCGGRPTASHWGVWASDQRVGVRRTPTQLLELTLALILGVTTLLVVLSHGPANGAVFVVGLAAYTLVRQGILSLRTEPRKTTWGGSITAAFSAIILIVAVFFLLR